MGNWYSIVQPAIGEVHAFCAPYFSDIALWWGGFWTKEVVPAVTKMAADLVTKELAKYVTTKTHQLLIENELQDTPVDVRVAGDAIMMKYAHRFASRFPDPAR
eukprot:TRINITY_DN10029_c0_g1_i1.p2 TRINITY_DN10029_c0_g1~~TRINITY_DN10029_c0_g1_i1.p2  ORF type:complete len:103 (+),score=19.68 TRINITY_DN10029_c0_g1_i1:160-468(+)